MKRRPSILTKGCRRAAIATLLATLGAPALAAKEPIPPPALTDESASGPRALVRRVELAPGAWLDMHDHGSRVLIALTDVSSRETLADGTRHDAVLKARDVKVSGPKRHQVVNTGKAPLIVVEIEPRSLAALPPDPGGDSLLEDPQHFRLEFENDEFRVLRFRLGPHQRSPMHSHGERVAVRLDALHARVTYSDGSVKEESAPAGEILYRAPLRHAVENLSDRAYEAVIVEFKSR